MRLPRKTSGTWSDWSGSGCRNVCSDCWRSFEKRKDRWTMAFWSSEKLKERIPAENLVEPYDEAAVKHCAYELAMGQQAAITTNSEVPAKDRKMVLTARQPLSIPPGQFGLLLTKEKVTVPKDAIGFISIRATKKFEGLVNVSGFHVDPGFSNHLKFSVYNAGA